MIQRTVFKAGELILLTSEEYSSQEIHGLFRVKADLDFYTLRLHYGAKHPPKGEYQEGLEGFVPWLMQQDVLEEVEHTEFWIGSYGEFRGIRESCDLGRLKRKA